MNTIKQLRQRCRELNVSIQKAHGKEQPRDLFDRWRIEPFALRRHFDGRGYEVTYKPPNAVSFAILENTTPKEVAALLVGIEFATYFAEDRKEKTT